MTEMEERSYEAANAALMILRADVRTIADHVDFVEDTINEAMERAGKLAEQESLDEIKTAANSLRGQAQDIYELAAVFVGFIDRFVKKFGEDEVDADKREKSEQPDATVDKPLEVDLRVKNCGTIFLLQPVSDAGRAWIAKNLTDPETQTIDGAVIVEHRYIRDICEGVEADHLMFAVDPSEDEVKTFFGGGAEEESNV